MKKEWLMALSVTGALLGAPLFAHAEGMAMTKSGPAEWQSYYRANSFGFPENFRSHHPGPAWVLVHAEELKLTPEQVKAEEKLKAEMISTTRANVETLQKAYAKYIADAATTEPSEAAITADIEALGKAQTKLSLSMIPSHFGAYAVLTAEQKKIFQGLVAQ